MIAHPRRLIVTLVLLSAGAALAVSMSSCSTTWPRRDPTGETFPTVSGNNLKGEAVQLPQDLAGAPALLAIGYDQDAQFDLDRWFQALMMARDLDKGPVTASGPLKALEIPTIPGWIPNLISGTIDGGMRRGIPEEDWAGVVTVYDDAATIAEFTGNEDGLTGRIVLLDETGKVAFFHDRGYSLSSLQRLIVVVEGLR